MYFLHKYFPATHNCPRVTDPAVTDSSWWYWSEGPAGLLIQDSLDDDVGPDGEHSTPCVMMLMMLWLITTSLTQQYKQTMRPGLPSSWRILCLCRHKLIFQKMFVLISDSSDCIKSWFHERHETVRECVWWCLNYFIISLSAPHSTSQEVQQSYLHITGSMFSGWSRNNWSTCFVWNCLWLLWRQTAV